MKYSQVKYVAPALLASPGFRSTHILLVVGSTPDDKNSYPSNALMSVLLPVLNSPTTTMRNRSSMRDCVSCNRAISSRDASFRRRISCVCRSSVFSRSITALWLALPGGEAMESSPRARRVTGRSRGSARSSIDSTVRSTRVLQFLKTDPFWPIPGIFKTGEEWRCFWPHMIVSLHHIVRP